MATEVAREDTTDSAYSGLARPPQEPETAQAEDMTELGAGGVCGGVPDGASEKL